MANAQDFFKPLSNAIANATAMTEVRRPDYFNHMKSVADSLATLKEGGLTNHMKSVADSLAALAWVAFLEKDCGMSFPTTHVGESWYMFKDMRSLSYSSLASTAICPSLKRQPIFRPHKAAASLLFQFLTEPRTHRQDGKKGQHHATTTNGELVSPAGWSRFLLSGEAATASVAPVCDVTGEDPVATDVTNTNTQEHVRILYSFTVNHC